MNRARLLVLLLLGVAAGCAPPPPSGAPATGSMRLAAGMALASPGDVSRVTVTLSGPDLEPRSADLEFLNSSWGGVLGAIPAGAQRVFALQAFNAENVLRYEGRAEGVTVTAGTQGVVSVLLQAVSVPAPFTNEAPIIEALVADTSRVLPGGTVSLSARARDPNAGDAVSYAWTAPAGGFSTPTQTSTTWTAPATEGPVKLSLRVSDPRGASSTVGLTVQVSTGTGADEVAVDFNTAPQVTALASTQSLLDVGEPTALSVSALDPEGDPLSYQWSATCAGALTGERTTRATFTPSALPQAGCNNCQVTVTVTDGRGGQNTGSVALCVLKDSRRAAPMVTSAFQSSAAATASQVLTFEVEASDPAGTALSFTWAPNGGTLGTATTGATSSRITWTAPACILPGTPTGVTATITNAPGLKVEQRFAVTGLPTCPSARWSRTGALSGERSQHAAILLPEGKVLVMGGFGANSSTMYRTEVYDPATGTWSSAGDMDVARGILVAALLSQGKVLVAAGGSTNYLSTAELYDPATKRWRSTGSLNTVRSWPTLTPLPQGKALIAGGTSVRNGNMATAEVYDPVSGTWSFTGSMADARYEHTATVLSDGKVLVVGGYSSKALATAELYDPATGTWRRTGSLAQTRYDHQAVRLSDGRVLVAGGTGEYGRLLSTEVYDPSTGTWSTTGALAEQHTGHTLTLLPNGRALLTGGEGSQGMMGRAEVYNPLTGAWHNTGRMDSARRAHTATLLPDGRVLAAGGLSSYYTTFETELYDPSTGI